MAFSLALQTQIQIISHYFWMNDKDANGPLTLLDAARTVLQATDELLVNELYQEMDAYSLTVVSQPTQQRAEAASSPAEGLAILIDEWLRNQNIGISNMDRTRREAQEL